MWAAVGAVCGGFFVIYSLWWMLLYNGPFRRLPGLFPVWPIVGNILQFQLNSVHSSIENLAERFQYKPFEIWFGPRYSVIVSDDKLAKKILRMRPITFQRSSNGSVVLNDTWGGTGVFTAERHDWARQRRLTAPLFNKLNSSAMFTPITFAAASTLKKWMKELQSSDAKSADIHVNHDCNNFTLNVILSVAFGVEEPWADADKDESDEKSPTLRSDIEFVMDHIGVRMFSPYKYWKYLPKSLLPKRDRDFEASNDRLMQHIAEMLGEYKNRLIDDKSSVPDNLLSRMILATESEGGEPSGCPMMRSKSKLKLTDKEVVSNASLFLFAGTDTTANSLAWSIWYLAKNPSVQSSVRDQICKYFSKINFRKKKGVEILNEAVTSAGFIPMIDSIFKETLRLKSPAPVLAFDPNEDNMKLEGIDVSLSKSAQVIILTRLISTSERYFGPDAKEWKPERWLDNSMSPETLQLLEDNFLSFGYGPRVCLGRDLANLEARVFLVLLLLAFEFVPALGVTEVEERFALTMRPQPIHLQMQKTEDNHGQKYFESLIL